MGRSCIAVSWENGVNGVLLSVPSHNIKRGVVLRTRMQLTADPNVIRKKKRNVRKAYLYVTAISYSVNINIEIEGKRRT